MLSLLAVGPSCTYLLGVANDLLLTTRFSSKAADIDLRGLRQDFRFFIEHYKQGYRQIADLVSFEGLKTRELVSHEARLTIKAIEGVDQELYRLRYLEEAHLDDQARKQFLRSFRYPRFNERRSRVANAHVNSLNWILAQDLDFNSNAEHSSQMKWDSFSKWLRSDDSIYWISGKPGSGKTTLVKYIQENERTRECLDTWSPGCKIISHYFWRPGSCMQKNLVGFYCSVLFQLLSGDSFALGGVMSLSEPKESPTDWTSVELRSSLWKALEFYEQGVCFFLDGLDEIDPEDGTEPGIPEFLDFVFELSKRSKIKLCLASRPDPVVLERSLHMYPRLRLQDLNYQDLMAYANGSVCLRKPNPSREDLQERPQIVRSLVDKAEGVFLWLVLATKSVNEGICNADSAEMVSERIFRLPKGLDDLYQDMWDRFGAANPPEYRQTAALYFKFLIASQKWDSRHSMYQSGMRPLNLMLATTSIADEVLDALDNPSRLVSPEAMLRTCQRVEERLNIYCVGLVEVGPRKQVDHELAAMVSWYGPTYDSVFPLRDSSALRFIHRTASDFLTDTDAGGKILSFDKSSGFSIVYRLMKAWLAEITLFAEHRSLDHWGRKLWEFRITWQDKACWVSKDWDHLIQLCERVADSGRLFNSNDFSSLSPRVGTDFQKVLNRDGFDDKLIIAKLKIGNLTAKYKYDISQKLGEDKDVFGGSDRSRVRTYRDLKRSLAEPNWQGWTQWAFYYLRPPYAVLEEPWQQYLFSAFGQVLCRSDGLTTEDLAFMIEIILFFNSEGAKFDQVVNMAIELHRWIAGHWKKADKHENRATQTQNAPNHCFFASASPGDIVEMLTIIMRKVSSRSGQETFSADLLHRCQILEQECMNHCGDSTCRVFGLTKMQINPRPNGFAWSWCETPNGLQVQMASRLMESMERWVMVSISPVIEDVNDSRKAKRDNSYEDHALESIVNGKACIGKIHGQRAIYERLKEYGLIKSINGMGESQPIRICCCEADGALGQGWKVGK